MDRVRCLLVKFDTKNCHSSIVRLTLGSRRPSGAARIPADMLGYCALGRGQPKRAERDDLRYGWCRRPAAAKG
jgi:hypothetical protein